MDITTVFGTVIVGSNPAEDTNLHSVSPETSKTLIMFYIKH